MWRPGGDNRSWRVGVTVTGRSLLSDNIEIDPGRELGTTQTKGYSGEEKGSMC